MSNNIKKSLVILGLAMVYGSGLARGEPEPPEQHCPPDCPSTQRDHEANSQMLHKPDPDNHQHIIQHKDRPNGPILPPH